MVRFGNGNTMRWHRFRPGSCRRTGGRTPGSMIRQRKSAALIGRHGALRRVCDRRRRGLRGAFDCRCVCRAGAPKPQPVPAQPDGRSTGPVSVNCGRMPVYSAGIRSRHPQGCGPQGYGPKDTGPKGAGPAAGAALPARRTAGIHRQANRNRVLSDAGRPVSPSPPSSPPSSLRRRDPERQPVLPAPPKFRKIK